MNNFWWAGFVVVFFVLGLYIGFDGGIDEGFYEEVLNYDNGMAFCDSLNDLEVYYDKTYGHWKWCSQGLGTIVCSSGDSCFNEEGVIRLSFSNPELKLIHRDYFESTKYPDPFVNVLTDESGSKNENS